MANIPILSRVHAPLTYRIGDSGQCLVVSETVIDHFARHRQRRFHAEAGGQLFARLGDGRIEVALATGPRASDHRTLSSYVPDRRAEHQEIEQYHAQGLHFIGDWHTHRQRQPRASSRDEQSIAECVRQSTHDLRGFVLVVVGTDPPPSGLEVSVHDGCRRYVLTPEPISDAPVRR